MRKVILAVVLLCSVEIMAYAASTHFALDNRTGVRITNMPEQIRFSPIWETETAGAMAIVSTNGIMVTSASEAGAYDWSPTQPGTYQFTHTVYVNGEQIGETLSATFVVSGMSPISADWSVGSITLKATGVSIEAEENVWLSYGDANTENGSWEYVDNFSRTIDDTEKSICVTDTGFSSRLGGIPPVRYRLQIGKSKDDARVTLYCTTRTRYGLFVGYDVYNKIFGLKPWMKPLRQSLADVTEIRRLCVNCGGFSSDNAKRLVNNEATAQGIRDVIGEFARKTCSGDLFVFYMATHGGDYSVIKPAYLAAYDTIYSVLSLQEDVRKFSSGVAIVGIIMACHSQSMTGDASTDETFQDWTNTWLSLCGFDQCLGNVAWIVSCASSENSYNSRNYTLFGQSFICDGLGAGYADARLYGVGYDGGNLNGNITMGELGRYARAFAVGISNKKSSTVKLENEGLLDRIVIREDVADSHLNRPDSPTNITLLEGDSKIQLAWNASATATNYRIYRYLADSQSEEWIGRSFSESYDDTEADIGKQYMYRVRAVNPVGLSEFSSASTGSRGSESYLAFLADLIGVSPALISSAEYTAKEKSIAANGCRTVGECYALGINPEDPNDDFKIEKFEIKDGTLVITLSHMTDVAGNTFESRIKTLGKENLSDADWVDLTDKDKSAYRFFKVMVDIP